MVQSSTLPLPSNQYLRAIFLSLDRFYSRPLKRYHRAKKVEKEWGLDRRVVGRAWTMLAPHGVVTPRTSPRRGHGGLVWETVEDEVAAVTLLFEVLPYHANASVYSALGYAPHAQRAPQSAPEP